jgi:hypothetical protein
MSTGKVLEDEGEGVNIIPELLRYTCYPKCTRENERSSPKPCLIYLVIFDMIMLIVVVIKSNKDQYIGH